MIESLVGLFVATIILGLSPGPAVFATIGRSLGQGLKATYLFIIGITLGDLTFSLMAMLGLSALATHYTGLFTVIKIVGGLYLIYLGLQSLRDAAKAKIHTTYKEKGWWLIASGFLLTASNPKDLLFFVGFVPAFIDLETAGYLDITLASLVIVTAFLLTLSFYAILANRIRQKLTEEKTLLWLHRIAGVLLISVGITVIIS